MIFPVIFALLLLMVAFIKHWLTVSGLWALGLLIIFLLNFAPLPFWGGFLFLFLGSALIQFFQKVFQKTENSFAEKGGQRDFWQVFANSFPTLIFITLGNIFSKNLFYAAAITTLTASFSDTVASEVGQFSNGPVYNFKLKKVSPGLSGGMSLLGTGASFIAAIILPTFMSILFILFFQPVKMIPLKYFLGIVFCGFLGNLIDSFLGLFQGKFLTPNGQITEKKTDQLLAGQPFLRNDGVNFLASGLSGLIFLVIVYWF